MKHFVQYHKNWEENCNPLANPKPYVYTTLCDAKESMVLNAWENAERVWLIYRSTPDAKKYFLGYTFKVTDVELKKDHFEMFGDPGKVNVFMPPVNLTEKKWFSAFLKSQGNFGFGFMSIQEEYIHRFEELLANSNTELR